MDGQFDVGQGLTPVLLIAIRLRHATVTLPAGVGLVDGILVEFQNNGGARIAQLRSFSDALVPERIEVGVIKFEERFAPITDGVPVIPSIRVIICSTRVTIFNARVILGVTTVVG